MQAASACPGRKVVTGSSRSNLKSVSPGTFDRCREVGPSDRTLRTGVAVQANNGGAGSRPRWHKSGALCQATRTGRNATDTPRVRMVVAPIGLVSEGSISQVVAGGCGVVVEGRCGGQRAALSTASRPVRVSASSTNPQPDVAAIAPKF